MHPSQDSREHLKLKKKTRPSAAPWSRGLNISPWISDEKGRCYTPLFINQATGKGRLYTRVCLKMGYIYIPRKPMEYHGISSCSSMVLMKIARLGQILQFGASIRIYPALQASISEMVSVGSSRRQLHFLRAEV